MQNTDAGRKWRSGDTFEAYVRDRLTTYPGFFCNHEGDLLPLMTVTIPGQFNRSGHGIDIMATDTRGRLWIIEVSRGSLRGAALVKLLGTRVDGNSQMSPAWREQKKNEFLKLPSAHEKLAALLEAPGISLEDARIEFEARFQKNRVQVAIAVPEGCHVEGAGTQISFGQQIYTFFVTPGIKFHSRPAKKAKS